jgi:hypothetical protein
MGLLLIVDLCILCIMKRIEFYLSEKQIRALKTLKKKLGLSVSELVRRAIDEFLIKYKK